MPVRSALAAVVSKLDASAEDAAPAQLVDTLAQALGAAVVLVERGGRKSAGRVTASVAGAAIGTPVDLSRAPWRTGEALRRRVVYVDNDRADDVFRAFTASSIAIAPLRGGAEGVWLGSLVVATGGELVDDQRAALLLIARMLTESLVAGEARQRAVRARDRVRTAIRIGELLDVSRADAVPDYESVCAEIVRVLGMRAAAITLLDAERGVFVREAHVGLPARWIDAHAPLDADVIERRPEIWRPIGVFEADVLQQLPDAALYAELDVRMIAMAVLRDEGKIVGAVSAIAIGEDPRFDDDERLWLEAVAGRISGAVRASRLTSAAIASERRYRHMVESCLEGVWSIGVDRKLSFVNAQLAELVGHTPAEMIGRSPLDFMSPTVHDGARRRFQLRQQGIPGRWHAPLRHRDGHDVWVIAASSPMFDDAGGFAGVVGFMTDVSERRALEQKVQQAQKLESLGLLAGGLAHDFNNLLVGILGNASLAREELPSGSTLDPLIADIETAGTRAAELTRQMLAYAGKAERRVELLDINQIVRDTLPLVAGVMSRKAAVSLALVDAPLHVSGDVVQLRQIVMNLLTNASDALAEGQGTITIRTGTVRLTGAEREAASIDHTLDHEEYAFVDVIDDGCGMDPATQARIFDPFFTTKFTGRGLGLAAVLGILRAHGGSIMVESKAGAGSRFHVLLPRATHEARRAMVAVPSQAPRSSQPPRELLGRRVFVVDDEHAVRQLAVRSLERAGFVVESASGGAEALARFASADPPIDVVVLDLTMPGLQGTDVLTELRARRPDVPVVISSGFDERDVRHRFGDDAASSFLAKPWTVGALVDAVVRAVGRASAAPRR